MSLIPQDFVDNLPADSFKAAVEIFKLFEFIKKHPDIKQKKVEVYKDFKEIYCMLKIFAETNKFKLDLPALGDFKNPEELKNFIEDKILKAKEQFNTIILKSDLSIIEEKYKVLFSNRFGFYFSREDIAKINHLTVNMQNSIEKNNMFSDNFKERLLTRVNDIQSSLHNKMSDLDKFWGLIGEIGIILNKYDDEISNSIVKDIKEILDTIWNIHAGSEDLLPGTPLPIDYKDVKTGGTAVQDNNQTISSISPDDLKITTTFDISDKDKFKNNF